MTSTLVKSVLAFLINFVEGLPDFKHEVLVELLLFVVKIIHAEEGFLFGTRTDNLSVNRKSFKTIQKWYTPNTIPSLEHRIPSNHFPSFLT